jgi:hypothetical protein
MPDIVTDQGDVNVSTCRSSGNARMRSIKVSIALLSSSNTPSGLVLATCYLHGDASLLQELVSLSRLNTRGLEYLDKRSHPPHVIVASSTWSRVGAYFVTPLARSRIFSSRRAISSANCSGGGAVLESKHPASRKRYK